MKIAKLGVIVLFLFLVGHATYTKAKEYHDMPIKSGVSILGVCPQMILAHLEISKVYEEFGLEAVITSGTEHVVHGPGSSHFRGMALDYRTRTIRPQLIETVRKKIETRLGEEFQVIFETNHFHIQYRPMRSL